MTLRTLAMENDGGGKQKLLAYAKGRNATCFPYVIWPKSQKLTNKKPTLKPLHPGNVTQQPTCRNPRMIRWRNDWMNQKPTATLMVLLLLGEYSKE